MATTYTDFVSGTLSAAIGNSDTSISSAGFANLPVLSGSDVAKIVLDPFGEFGAPEIAYVTTHTASSTTVSGVLRGQDAATGGGAARSHGVGVLFIHAPLASDMAAIGTNVSSVINSPGTTLATAGPPAIVAGGTQVVGSSTAISKADHRHALAAGSPVLSAPGDASEQGASDEVARADHRHEREAFAAALSPIGTAMAPGVAGTVARGDHVHVIGPGAVSDAAMLGGSLRALRVATSTTLPAGQPVGTMVWATDKKRLYVLVSTGPDVWTFDTAHPQMAVAETPSVNMAPTGLSGNTQLTGFVATTPGEVTVNTNGLVIPSTALWEIGGQGGFASVSGTGMFRLFAVQINGSTSNMLSASGDAQGSATSGFGYSPGSVKQMIRLNAGSTIRMVMRHNHTTSLGVSGMLWAQRIGD
jgi:hypothetical protein